jgi:hypothetical protein
LTKSLPEILKEVEILDNETRNFKMELMKLCWFMRGSVTVEDAFLMTVEDREILSKIIKENLETTKKSGLPFF